MEDDMAITLFCKKQLSRHITYNTKISFGKRLLYATGFVSAGVIACFIQITFVHNNPDMQDSWLTGGMRIERDNTQELKGQIEAYKKEVEKLNETNQKLIDNHSKVLASRGDVNRGTVYDYTKLSAPKEISKIIDLKCKEKGFENMDEIYPIVAYESGFNPKTRTLTKHEDSRGLLQINTFTNYPKEFDKNKLYDPAYNLDYQLPELLIFYKLGKSKGLKGVELSCSISKLGQRPLWSDKKTRNYIISTIEKYYKEVTAAKISI